MQFSTPLRYPGGKGKLTEFLKYVVSGNNLIGCDYVEPYAGGAGIAINLLLHGYARHIHLNDLNASVYSFWHSVVHYPDELCRLICDTPVTMDEWHKQKSIQANHQNHSQLEIGFSTFFLNRTNRSGIIWGGVIGGKKQTGEWKIDARFNKDNLINRIERIALYSNAISIYNEDAVKFITKKIPSLPRKTLVYLDPPYYVKGKGLYENHYIHDDHLKIAQIVATKLKRPWIVSYDHAPEIVDMYPNFKSIVYGINYSAQDRYKGAEIMFFSDRLEVPDVENPVAVRVA
ncbi:D12 class N6 adenine-specific DNA methyltransferase [uncultured Desulfovibrio sp.]|uniref:site-specific DNA-methyltransferase (adenine-specific) n=1 Tax=uncultured Desulfovibrio sp. TaxID=167968 RepID=A0A212IWB6_9BACT|nr:DNA adenine methylase [uncultured Desulfovibrio sp.]SBV91452.1 D12 class N6 adenine-specific DNA methyltransferase [uncultured Desulfovibrio sp.]